MWFFSPNSHCLHQSWCQQEAFQVVVSIFYCVGICGSISNSGISWKTGSLWIFALPFVSFPTLCLCSTAFSLWCSSEIFFHMAATSSASCYFCSCCFSVCSCPWLLVSFEVVLWPCASCVLAVVRGLASPPCFCPQNQSVSYPVSMQLDRKSVV